MGSYKTKEDDVAKISTSIYVTNFPESLLAKELFHSCKVYGHVMDSFIPTKRAKNASGSNVGAKMAGGFRDKKTNVFSSEKENTKVTNVNGGWGISFVSALKRDKNNSDTPSASSFSSILKGNLHSPSPLSFGPALVLDDSCKVTHDLDSYIMGELKQFSSINNVRVLLANEGFNILNIAYLGGLWVMIELDSANTKSKLLQHVGVASWFNQLCNAQGDFVSRERVVWVDIEGVPLHAWSYNTFKKIGSKWGEMLDLEESKDALFARKRICIRTKQEDNILEKFKIIIRGKVFVVRAKELFAWTPEFKHITEGMVGIDDNSVSEGPNYSSRITLDMIYGTWLHSKDSKDLYYFYLLPQANFRESRTESERFGSVFNTQGAFAFNDFISNSGLYLMFRWKVIRLLGLIHRTCFPRVPKTLYPERFLNLVSPISKERSAVELFFDHCSFAKGSNSSFIALIPKSIAPKLVTLTSGMTSILVNGSPTSEFQFYRGLKQVDPLAPYLFILIMELLHLSFSRVVDAGIFKGVNSWFCTLLNAYNDFASDERVVWVDIEGIPLHVWSRETFAKIGNKWGEALDIEDNFGSSFA
ncbi:hypothetical protein Tco_0174832, partial [Tanacetum coccineum]